MITLGTTTMQGAFIQSKSVTMKTPLGQMILKTAQRQLEEADKALQLEQAIVAETKRVIGAMQRQQGEYLSSYWIRISETKTRIRQQMTDGTYQQSQTEVV